MPGGHDGDVDGQKDPHHKEQLGVFHYLFVKHFVKTENTSLT